MDQEQAKALAWWTEAVFHEWQQRPGPRYARLAAAILEAIDRKTVREGMRIPAERTLAAAVGASRGTVVACFDRLVTVGVLTRRQGDGTYISGRPKWTAQATSVTTAMLRGIAADRETIDLSQSSPGDLSHLPPIDPAEAFASLDGHGLAPQGLPRLRSVLARHLTTHLSLPTTEDQLVITDGAQEALWLLTRVIPARVILASCPTYPGLTSAIRGSRAAVTQINSDSAGPDPAAMERAGRTPGAVAFLMPTGHNPTGAIMPAVRRQSIAEIAGSGKVTVIEDLALADLPLDSAGATEVPPPVSSLSPAVIAVGSASKLLWGGLRVGWIRVSDEPLRSALIGRKTALNQAASAVSQAITAALLAAITPGWLAAHRAALAQRRDYLAALIREHLPAWTADPPHAGLSLWVRLPVTSADPYLHAAARHGVTVAPGALACVDGRHRGYVRLSFAEQQSALELAVERLAAAWESHSADLAAAPTSPF